jgi:AraC-like DNA-binding protein
MRTGTKQKRLADAAWRMVLKADVETVAELTVSEIARRLNVSRPNLSRAFITHFSISLRRLIEIKKFTMFEVLLMLNRTRTVKETLEVLDIRDPSHFIKKFRAWRYQTPGQRCRAIRKENAKQEDQSTRK